MHIGLADLKWRGHHTPYVVYLSRYLTDRGHDVTFVTDGRNPRLEDLPDDLYVHTEPFPTADADPTDLRSSLYEQYVRTRELHRIFNVTDAHEFDALHLLSFDRTQVPTWAASRLRMSRLPPVVATLHRDAFTGASDATCAKRLTLGATIRALSRTLADGTVESLTVHADAIRDRIIATVDGATKANTRTIPAPTPEPSTDATPDEARERLDLPEDVPLLLFFGELREEKGPDLLAEALQKVDQPVTAVFAGSGVDYTQPEVDQWKQRVDPPVQLLDRLEFVPETDVDLYFRAADALVLPYRRQRGISGPLRRACMAGTPVVGWAESDVGEIIEQHEIGWTFDRDTPASLRKTLATALDNYDAREWDLLEAFAQSRHWRETGSELEDLYRSLARTKHGSARAGER